MPSSCLVCDRIAQIAYDANRHFVAELETGYVVMGDYQFFRGYTLFLCKHHVAELHQLERSVKERFLIEMSLVGESVFKCFQPRKLNYESLGNAEPHLHWHFFPRHADDPSPGTSSWKVDRNVRYDEKYRPSDADLADMKQRLLSELRQREDLNIIRT